ncbi:DUF2442 domain-containing protein [Ornithobacterium rhinotracheale]
MGGIFREEDIKDTIKKVWFTTERICIETQAGEKLSRPLEAFPLLLEATPPQRNDFEVSKFRDAIHWEALDEDIHISSFFNQKEVNKDNEIAEIFNRFPYLNVSQVAEYMRINKSLLSQYIYGFKNPSPERKKQIEETLHELGRELLAVRF